MSYAIKEGLKYIQENYFPKHRIYLKHLTVASLLFQIKLLTIKFQNKSVILSQW